MQMQRQRQQPYPIHIPSDSHTLIPAGRSITYPLNILLISTTARARARARIIYPIPSSRPSLFRLRSSSNDADADDVSPDSNSNSDSLVNSLSNYKEVDIEKIGKNSCRIRSKIAIKASLDSVWTILTDYERLPDFIPGLALSQLLQRRDNFARLLQIGQQNLAFGLKFNAKGIVDCFERDLESLPFGQRRDIEFKMIEGDFQLFEGKWSIEQCNMDRCKSRNSLVGQQFCTTLAYVVDVEPKLWLPVGLVEGRLCREIKVNLSCIREEAEKAMHNTLAAQYFV